MGKFKSELTWSVSRDRLFSDCRRAYYYHYYASWGGWRADAEEFTRKAYILKNSRNIDAWIGDIVHQIIKWVLKSKSVKSHISFEEAKNKAKQLLSRTWEQSRSKMWMNDTKNNLNLFEHYYNREPDREALTLKLTKAVKSIRNFYDSGLVDLFSDMSQECFLKIDELDSFNFEGIKVFAVPDFAVYNEGYVLYDWKTGKPSDKDIFQLSCYILYAVEKWKAERRTIKVIPVYLAVDKVSLTPVKEVEEDTIKSYIKSSIEEMKSVLLNLGENAANIENCPKTDDTWRCKNCKFQEICE